MFHKRTPLVSVIVPSRNESKLLPGCLISLTAQKTRFPYEILVVDTNSTDRTRAIAKSFGVRLISQPQKGKVFAFQKGALLARGDILCFTESDCIVPPHWIQTIVDYLNKHPDVASVSGTYTFYSSTWFYNMLAILAHHIGRLAYRLLYGTDSLRGSNFAIRKDVYRSVGGFSEKYLEFYDVELGRRVRRIGSIHHLPGLQIQTSDRRVRGRIPTFIREFVPTFVKNILLNRPIPSQTYQHIR